MNYYHQDITHSMKTMLKLLAILISIIYILALLSCSQETTEEVIIPSGEETPTITGNESLEQPVQTTIEAPFITIDELLQNTQSNANIIIVDVRSDEDYQISHIKGAISVPESIIKAGEWDPPEAKSLVLY